MEDVLVFLHNDVGFGWGLAIVMLTVLVRLVILPLTIKQYRSMLAMQRLQPEIKAIRERYKDDRQRMQEATMRFYRENKVSPLSSCLPLVLQLPVFISLFYLLQNDLAKHLTENLGWLFIPNLTKPATGTVLAVLMVVYVGSQFLSSYLMMTSNTDKTQRLIMLALPLVFVIFVIRFPTGLIVYWITTNVWTVGQQLVLKRLVATHVDEEIDGSSVKAVVPTSGGKTTTAPRQGGGKPPPPPKKKKKRSGRRR